MVLVPHTHLRVLEPRTASHVAVSSTASWSRPSH
jgi:hypothetical protein